MSTEKWAVFKNAGDLLSALYNYRGKSGELFPSEVTRAEDGRWALSLAELRCGEELGVVRAQLGWNVEVMESQPAGRSVPLHTCLGGLWDYRDPCSHDCRIDRQGLGGPLSGPAEAGAWVQPDGMGFGSYDPGASGIRYLIGVKDEREAIESLKFLTDCLTHGIRAAPILLDSVSEAMPFRFFWLIEMDKPAHPILISASRAWWGPLGYGVQVYEEWPFHLEVPEEHLNLFDWGRDAAIVLLSRSDPGVIVVRRWQPEFPYLVDMANLTSRGCSVAEAICDPDQGPNVRLEVRLRLDPEDLRRSFEARRDDLKLEIESKQKRLEWMDQRAGPADDLKMAPEPLFLYWDFGGQIPYELRLLLLEWSDQAEDLRSLYYQKLPAGCLPTGLFPDRAEVHVLTTGAALGKASSPTLGARLRDYRPGRDGLWYDLSPDWVPFGLRIFMPHDQRVALYPDLRPGEVAASKLAAALLPEGSEDKSDWAALLVPGSDGRAGSVVLQVSPFRPLIESFEWECALDFRFEPASVAEEVSGWVKKSILQSVSESFEAAVAEEAQGRMASERGRLTELVEDCGKQVDQRSKMVGRGEQELQEYDNLLATLKRLGSDAATLRTQIGQNAQSFKLMLGSAGSLTGNAKAVGKELEAQGGLIMDLRRRLDRIRDLIARFKGWFRVWSA